jgi:hypothetical protein
MGTYREDTEVTLKGVLMVKFGTISSIKVNNDNNRLYNPLKKIGS